MAKAASGHRAHSVQDSFYERLGRFTFYAALLDRNVGLRLRWISKIQGENVSDILVSQKPMKLRFDKLRQLIQKKFEERPAVLREFENWFTRFDRARALRNDYIHAYWQVDSSSGTEPSVICFPLHWETDNNTVTPTTHITFAEFDEQIEELKQLTADFHLLCKRHSLEP